MAAAQSAGRGRHGNVWTSVPGNLYASLLLRPWPGDRAGDYSFILALALHAAVACFLPDPTLLKIKWPNDLLLDGRKCAGILLESPEPGVLLAGMGVNLVSAPEGRAFLNDYATVSVSPDSLLMCLEPALTAWVDLYRARGLVPILAEWQTKAAGVGEAVRVRLPQETFDGVWAGIDDQGALRVRLSDGSERRVLSGEVFFGDDV